VRGDVAAERVDEADDRPMACGLGDGEGGLEPADGEEEAGRVAILQDALERVLGRARVVLVVEVAQLDRRQPAKADIADGIELPLGGQFDLLGPEDRGCEPAVELAANSDDGKRELNGAAPCVARLAGGS
jgi:hypothetical protein